MSDGEYVEIVPFLTDTPDFVKGFEVGIVYMAMRHGEAAIGGLYHADNEEQLLLMAHRLGYAVTRERHADGWIKMEFVRPARPAA